MKTKIIKQRKVRVTEDESKYTYQFGKWWLLKDAQDGTIIFRGKSLRDIEEYLNENK